MSDILKTSRKRKDKKKNVSEKEMQTKAHNAHGTSIHNRYYIWETN